VATPADTALTAPTADFTEGVETVNTVVYLIADLFFGTGCVPIGAFLESNLPVPGRCSRHAPGREELTSGSGQSRIDKAVAILTVRPLM
jgi:hypothetical protein